MVQLTPVGLHLRKDITKKCQCTVKALLSLFWTQEKPQLGLYNPINGENPSIHIFLNQPKLDQFCYYLRETILSVDES